MKTCPKCHKIYEDSQNFCSEDGTPLVLTPVSQTLRGETEAPNPPVPAAQPETEQQGQPDSGQGTGTREQQNWQQQIWKTTESTAQNLEIISGRS